MCTISFESIKPCQYHTDQTCLLLLFNKLWGILEKIHLHNFRMFHLWVVRTISKVTFCEIFIFQHNFFVASILGTGWILRLVFGSNVLKCTKFQITKLTDIWQMLFSYQHCLDHDYHKLHNDFFYLNYFIKFIINKSEDFHRNPC